MESSTSPTSSSSQTSGKGSSCSHFHNPTHELFCFLQGNVGLAKSVWIPGSSSSSFLLHLISHCPSRAESRDRGQRLFPYADGLYVTSSILSYRSHRIFLITTRRWLDIIVLRGTATVQFSITKTFVHWRAVLKHELRLGTSIVPTGLPWGESPGFLSQRPSPPTDATHCSRSQNLSISSLTLWRRFESRRERVPQSTFAA